MKLLALVVIAACGGTDPNGQRYEAIDAAADVLRDDEPVVARDPWNGTAIFDESSIAAVYDSDTPSPATGIAPPVFPLLSVPPPGPLVAGGHATTIRSIAVVDDGSVALTADRDGGVRLWPSLDGKHEPIAIAMASPMTLAIAHDDDELVLAGLDGAGSLELVRTSAAGEVHVRARVQLERPVVGMLATKDGIAALLDDQSVAVFDLRGLRAGTLVPDPGQRIAALVARRDRVLALVNADGGTRGRWLELDGTPRWGDETPALKIDPSSTALSPDFTKIAAIGLDKKSVVVASLTTGRVIEKALELEFSDSSMGVLGFVDENTLAVQDGDSVKWWRKKSLEESEVFRFGQSTAIVDGKFVQANGVSLMLVSRAATRYLGYRVSNASTIRATAGGFLVTSGSVVIGIDDQLRERRAVKLPAIASLTTVDQVVPIDGRHAFVMGRAQKGVEIHRVDFDDPKATELVAKAEWATISYEPATRLFAVQDPEYVWFGHFDPKTGKTEQPVRLYAKNATVVLLDPAVANGLVAVVAEVDSVQMATADMIEIRGVRTDRIEPFDVVRRRTVNLNDQEQMNGVVNVDELMGRMDVYRNARAHRRTSPDGTLVAMVDASRISLRDKAGVVKWTVTNPGVDDVAWTPEGELVAIGGAIARLDRESGALGDRQCGWGFGSWDSDEGVGSMGSPVCDAE